MEPNRQQKKLINNTDGIYLVDAGAGTGKTFAITRRYANILEKQDVEPEDLLLVTFTNNAAEEMKKKVVNICESYSPAELREAPISTFHSLSNQLVREHGFKAPQLLGIDDRITSSTTIIENTVLEEQEFQRFMNRFIEGHPEYRDFYRIIYDQSNLLGLVKKLASKGVFPTRDGWYQNGEKYLDGDFDEFLDLFQEANERDGNRQSDLRRRLSGYHRKCFPEDAPDSREVRGVKCKQVPEEVAERAFSEDREELKDFVHDLYYGYIKYALGRNYLNFNLLLMFAYILLSEDHQLRQEYSYRYVMIDEFQDTSEIQLKLTLLLAQEPNICAVGDWKQSIYSFQYADVDNIRRFEKRLNRYRNELNQDNQRINYQIGKIEKIPLEKNYRSTQKILDFSEQSLALEATQRESLDKKEIMENVTSLESCEAMNGPSSIELVRSEQEELAVLQKIQEIVDSEDYLVDEEDDLRKPDYSDIVVLSRTSKFGLELQKKASEYGVPLVYEGGVELFKTDPAILLLAWLRVLDYRDSRRGWSVVLEHAGYSLDETSHILDTRDYPDDMWGFRRELGRVDGVSTVARKVFENYGICNVFSDKIVEVLQSTFESSYMNLGRLIQFIEDNIENGTRYEVDNSQREDVVKARTIHAEKGLEHPIVIISDINQSRFPSQGSGSGRIDYREPIGLRQKKTCQKQDTPYIYDNWQTEILNKCLTGQYNEERRLMYVAMTRPKRHLILTANTQNPSPFHTNLNKQPQEIQEPDLEKIEPEEKQHKKLEIQKPSQKTPLKRPVHSIMNRLEKDVGKGEKYGKKVHHYAQQYANGKNIEPENIDEENVKQFIDGLEGELITEKTTHLPLQTENRKIVLKGAIDLIHKKDKKIEIIDYKTDREKTNQKEYKKQLSAYYHTIKACYGEKKVVPKIFYTSNGEEREIDPLSRPELEEEI